MFILAETAKASGGSSWIILVVLGVAMVGMMLMSIIPQKKRQKKAQEMMASIKVGTKVKTIGGFVGEICSINEAEGTFTLDISANNDRSTMVQIDRSAVYTVLVPAGNTGEVLVEIEKAEEIVASDDLMDDKKAEEKKASKKSNKKSGKVDLDAESNVEDTNDIII